VVLAVVLVALATVLIALTVSTVSIVLVALIVFIAVGIDAAVIVAGADIVAVEAIAEEDDRFRLINGNPVIYREEPLQSQGLFSISMNIRDKLQYIG